MHAADPRPTYSLSPDDGMNFDESKDDRALDAGDFDPSMGVPSITDRLMVLCNRAATRVNAKYPDVRFGLLAYVNYFRPPVREKVNPSIVPQIAPINFSRRHPMTDDAVPHNKELRQAIEGWGKAATETSIYFYGYHLAETSAPVPMIRKWSADVPFVLKNNCKYFQPETLPNFETTMHALYLGNRLAFDATLKPEEVLDELNTRFYGRAAKEMAAYWKYVDDVWTDTPEYSGCCFGYLRIWTPDRLAKARELMDAGLAACQTPVETRRAKLADDSLRLFEAFMKMRRDQAEGRFAELPAAGEGVAEDGPRPRREVQGQSLLHARAVDAAHGGRPVLLVVLRAGLRRHRPDRARLRRSDAETAPRIPLSGGRRQEGRVARLRQAGLR